MSYKMSALVNTVATPCPYAGLKAWMATVAGVIMQIVINIKQPPPSELVHFLRFIRI